MMMGGRRGSWVIAGILIKAHAVSQGGPPPAGQEGGVMTSPAGPLGRLRSCSAPFLAALSHHGVCLGKISNVKPLQHPEHAAKGDAMERTAGNRNRD